MTGDLLTDLLRMLVDGHALTLPAVAQRAGVSPDLVEQALFDLERAGYLSVLDACCSGNKCQGCADKDLCHLLHGGQIWTVTEKGLRAARRTQGSG